MSVVSLIYVNFYAFIVSLPRSPEALDGRPPPGSHEMQIHFAEKVPKPVGCRGPWEAEMQATFQSRMWDHDETGPEAFFWWSLEGPFAQTTGSPEKQFWQSSNFCTALMRLQSIVLVA